MHTIPLISRQRANSLFGGNLGLVAVRAFDILLTWQERATQRHALAAQEIRMLHDMGLSRADALREAAKPFWRV